MKSQPKSGLDALLADLAPKKQMNTLDKTSLDWDKHKKENKLEEELDENSKNGWDPVWACQASPGGRKGFLDKQDFLDRANHRQFKIEQARSLWACSACG